MSWSSSLLFLLQYGLYRHMQDHDKPQFSDIHLLILDTCQFPRGTFIRDLEVIEKFEEDSADLAALRTWRLSDKYFGEYLTQGQLNVNGKCSQTSMQQLIDMGLFELCPMLGITSQWSTWVTAVLKIRSNFDKPTIVTDKKSVRTAITMSQACFGGRWTLPIAVTLLSLQISWYLGTTHPSNSSTPIHPIPAAHQAPTCGPYSQPRRPASNTSSRPKSTSFETSPSNAQQSPQTTAIASPALYCRESMHLFHIILQPEC